ncbi:MAG: hydroxyacid dehydrogenase [bacterium]|nr:hydroxyacid dehydrogenase [bacterium]
MPATRRPVVVPVFIPGLESLLCGETEWSALEAIADLPDRTPLAGFAVEGAAERLRDATVLLTGWGCPAIDAAALDLAPNLELIAHAAGTVKEMVTPELWERGVRVCSAAAANAVPVAEFTLAAILLANKDAFASNQRYHASGAAAARVGFDVGNRNKVVGIVSASRVGRCVIEMLAPFDLRVLLFDPYLDEAEARAMATEPVGLDELLERSDVVSLHAPLIPETTEMIGKRELARMRDGATLINTARGRICNAEALEVELVSGRLRAVIDTSEPEPLPDNSPLRGLSNVFLTPHIAGSLGTEIPRMTQLAIDEIGRLARGEALHHEVRRTELERQA